MNYLFEVKDKQIIQYRFDILLIYIYAKIF